MTKIKDITQSPKYIDNFLEVTSDLFKRIDTESSNSLSSLMVFVYNLDKLIRTYTPDELGVCDIDNTEPLVPFSLKVTMHEFKFTLLGTFPEPCKEHIDDCVVHSFAVQLKDVCKLVIDMLRNENKTRINEVLKYD